MYNVSNFNAKIKTARIYRGYKKQVDICERIDISKQTWSLWERGTRLPTGQQIAALCNFLQLSPLYFYSDDTDIEECDLLYAKSEKISLPFIATGVTAQIEKIFRLAFRKPGVYLLEVYPGAGTTRAVYEAQRKIKENPDKLPVVFDNTRISDIMNIREAVSDHPQQSVIITGSSEFMQQIKPGLEDFIFFSIHNIRHSDFEAILGKALPGLPLGIRTLILTETCYSLPKLALLCRKLQRARLDKRWEMTFDSVMALCDRVNKIRNNTGNEE